ncbi:hypothetical protein Emed_006134 [Eimeria media]
MGPSGSGKTTLLDCLSGKKQQHEGEVFLNGEPRVYRQLQRVAIYLPQEAYYSGLEVVRELLDFSATLKTNYQKEERDALVDGTLEFLGLTKVADKRVGNTRVRGISGGQRQRLMAGQALVSLSQLCFCDEPTSDTPQEDALFVSSSNGIYLREKGVSGCLGPQFSCSINSSSCCFCISSRSSSSTKRSGILITNSTNYAAARAEAEQSSSSTSAAATAAATTTTAAATTTSIAATTAAPATAAAATTTKATTASASAAAALSSTPSAAASPAAAAAAAGVAVLCHSLQLYENPAECYLRLVTPGCPGYCLEALADNYEKTQKPLDEQKVQRHLKMRQQQKSYTPNRSPYRFPFKSSPSPSSAACQQTDAVAAGEEEALMHALEVQEKEREAERQRERESQDEGVAALGMLLQDQTQRRQPASWLTQYCVLQRRALKRTARDKRAFVLSVISIYCFSVVVGILFLNVYSREAVFYQLSSHVLMALTLSIIPFVNTIGYLERRLQFMVNILCFFKTHLQVDFYESVQR